MRVPLVHRIALHHVRLFEGVGDGEAHYLAQLFVIHGENLVCDNEHGGLDGETRVLLDHAIEGLIEVDPCCVELLHALLQLAYAIEVLPLGGRHRIVEIEEGPGLLFNARVCLQKLLEAVAGFSLQLLVLVFVRV